MKWLLSDAEREENTDRATELMRSIVERRTAVSQPIHWLLEAGAVLARHSPQTAEVDLMMLHGLQLPINDDAAVMGRACRMTIASRQHLFDTLYHAVALETAGGTLITADEQYFAAGAAFGSISRLADWQAPD